MRYYGSLSQTSVLGIRKIKWALKTTHSVSPWCTFGPTENDCNMTKIIIFYFTVKVHPQSFQTMYGVPLNSNHTTFYGYGKIINLYSAVSFFHLFSPFSQSEMFYSNAYKSTMEGARRKTFFFGVN